MLPDFSDDTVIRQPSQTMSFTLSQFNLRTLLELNKSPSVSSLLRMIQPFP